MGVHPQHARTKSIEPWPSQRQCHREVTAPFSKPWVIPTHSPHKIKRDADTKSLEMVSRRNQAIPSGLRQVCHWSQHLPIVPIWIHPSWIGGCGHREHCHSSGIVNEDFVIKTVLMMSLPVFSHWFFLLTSFFLPYLWFTHGLSLPASFSFWPCLVLLLFHSALVLRRPKIDHAVLGSTWPRVTWQNAACWLVESDF